MYNKSICFPNNIDKNITYINKQLCISQKNKNLCIYLCKTKNQIDDYKHNWNYYKYKLNPYENIYNYKKKSISKKIPVSRSYFKLNEILIDNNLFKKYENVLCLAEAPGGFIELLLDKKLATNITGNTLCSTSKKIPQWNKKILKKNVNLLNDSGDLTDINVINNMVLNLKNHTQNLITCDGGIDYSLNFNNQELLSYNLIYCEILTGLQLLKNKGIFIIKVFDLFYNLNINLIYLLYLSFDKIVISKPHTSRPSNSEKYIICINYNLNSGIKIINLLKLNFKKKRLNLKLPDKFYEFIYYLNKNYSFHQIYYINLIIKSIKEKKYINNKKNDNICINWCEKYNIKFNQI
jgi:23S rRNA U2552 (ribose-2'-O)-methylase RlmE/FtsJ